jgi:hypothetical protein
MLLDHTQRRTAVGRTTLDERSVRRRDLYLTTHDTHNRQISTPPVGFKPTISAGERPAAAHLLTQVAAGWQPAATWVNTTRYCKYCQVLLMMGENIARNI